MFSMIIKAPTIRELQAKVIEAADSYRVKIEIGSPFRIPDEYAARDAQRAMFDEIPEGYTSNIPQTIRSRTEVQQEIANAQRPESPEPERDSDVLALDRDSTGLPWDKRIHAESRALNKDGSWRTRRNLDDAVYDKVVNELRADIMKGKGRPTDAVVGTFPTQQMTLPEVAQPSNVMQFAPPQQQWTPPPVPPTNVHVEPPVFTVPVAQPIATPVATAQPAVAQNTYDNIAIPTGSKPAHSFASFKAKLIPTLAELVKEKKIDPGYIQELNTYFGTKNLWEVNDAQCHELFELFAKFGFITKVEA